MQPHHQSPKEFYNIILMCAIAGGILFVWNIFFKPVPVKTAPVASSAPASEFYDAPPSVNTVAATAATFAAGRTVAEGIPFENNAVKGSISLRGGRLDDISLKNYRNTLDEDSDLVHLMQPENGDYFIETGYIPVDDANKEFLPEKNTTWTKAADSPDTLTPESPVILQFENSSLRIRRTISIDDRYMLRYDDVVENMSVQSLPLAYYAATDKRLPNASEKEKFKTPLVHEGVLAGTEGTIRELGFDDIIEDNGVSFPLGQSWAGITDHYWLSAVVPPKDAVTEIEITPYSAARGNVRVQAGFITPKADIAPGGRAEFSAYVFAGAKELGALDDVEDRLGAVRFDRAIDFGWVYFLSKPLFILLDTLRGWVGNFGLAIIAMTCIIRAMLFPLAHKSYYGMQRMKDLQPKIAELREKHKNDAQARNNAMMKLYQKEKVNPVTSGCLPMLLQLPVFFALYKVLLVSIEMRHAPFYLWIQDLAAADPSNIFTLFGLIPWNPPLAVMHVGVLPILVGVTMYIQQRLSPQPMDETQAKIMRFLPFFFTFIFAGFAAGLVLYWFVSNLLSIMQQAYIKYQFAKEAESIGLKKE